VDESVCRLQRKTLRSVWWIWRAQIQKASEISMQNIKRRRVRVYLFHRQQYCADTKVSVCRYGFYLYLTVEYKID
jgi:hypothetical protein